MAEKLEPELVGALLALMAHDLRNPLSALRSNLGFVEGGLDLSDTDTKEALQDTYVSCDSLLRIIDNLELLGRELRGDEPQPSSLPVEGLVQDIVSTHQSLADSHGVQLNLRPAGAEDSPWVRCEREALATSVANLVRNAIQHGGSGTSVLVSYGLTDGRCFIRVQDKGASVPEDLRSTAFTAAGQLTSKKNSRTRYGYGLGLYAAAAGALRAGAELRVEPTDEGGNRVTLLLPVNE